MTPWLRYLIAFIVFCHGFIYVRIGLSLPGPIKEWKGNSWLLAGAMKHDQLRALIVGLHVLAGVAIIACAAAIGFAPELPAWWRPLALAGGVLGVAAFAVFWDGQSQFLIQEGLIGAFVSLILGIAAALYPLAFSR